MLCLVWKEVQVVLPQRLAFHLLLQGQQQELHQHPLPLKQKLKSLEKPHLNFHPTWPTHQTSHQAGQFLHPCLQDLEDKPVPGGCVKEFMVKLTGHDRGEMFVHNNVMQPVWGFSILPMVVECRGENSKWTPWWLPGEIFGRRCESWSSGDNTKVGAPQTQARLRAS